MKLGVIAQPFRMWRLVFAVVVLALAVALPAGRHAQAARVVFVDAAATGANDGTSWTDAYQTLGLALVLEAGPVEFWVAGGTYTPVGLITSPRAPKLVIHAGQELYGGFAGSETSRDQRSPGAHLTTLTGERGASGLDDNFYNVVTFDLGVNERAVLDGFTVARGHDERTDGSAGGIAINGGKPEIRNVKVVDNDGQRGGAISVSTAQTVTLDGLIMFGNRELLPAPEVGGIKSNESNVTILNSQLGNFGPLNGAVAEFTESSAVIQNSVFQSNHRGIGLLVHEGSYNLRGVEFRNMGTGIVEDNGASVTADAVSFNFNELAFRTTTGSFDLTNATFFKNVQGMSVSSPLTITNATFTENGAASNTATSIPKLINIVSWDNEGGSPPTRPAIVQHGVIEGAANCTNGQLTCTDVVFTNPLLGDLDSWGGPLLTVQIGLAGPAVDAGDPASCPDHDARFFARPVDGDGDGSKQCDLGAFELDPPRFGFAEATSVAREPGGTDELTVVVDGLRTEDMTVRYRVRGGSASPGSDFVLEEGQFVFPKDPCPHQQAGVSPPPACNAPPREQTFALQVNDDLFVEPDETIVVELADPVGALLGSSAVHTVTIEDNELRLKCGAFPATIVGTPAGEVLRGTPGRDVVVARGGDDRVRALGGRDVVCGGPGDDRLFGGTGNDRLAGQGGADILRGQAGHDTLFGNNGDDMLAGGVGRDRLFGVGGVDELKGNQGSDRLSGGGGQPDTCDGGQGEDVLTRRAGCEVVLGVP